jgi:hypothetical protein
MIVALERIYQVELQSLDLGAILVTLRRVVITSENSIVLELSLRETSKQSRKQRAKADSCCHCMALLMMDQ